MWGQLRGPRYWVQLDGSRHLSFTDFQVLLPQLGPYLLAFFDRHLRHRSARLLDGPSRRYPETDSCRDREPMPVLARWAKHSESYGCPSVRGV